MWVQERNPLEVIGRTTSPVIPAHVLQELQEKRRQHGCQRPDCPRRQRPQRQGWLRRALLAIRTWAWG